MLTLFQLSVGHVYWLMQRICAHFLNGKKNLIFRLNDVFKISFCCIYSKLQSDFFSQSVVFPANVYIKCKIEEARRRKEFRSLLYKTQPCLCKNSDKM